VQRNATRPPGERPHAAPAESSNELIESYKNTAQSFLSQQAPAHCGEAVDPHDLPGQIRSRGNARLDRNPGGHED
jgi:hypothetical protein